MFEIFIIVLNFVDLNGMVFVPLESMPYFSNTCDRLKMSISFFLAKSANLFTANNFQVIFVKSQVLLMQKIDKFCCIIFFLFRPLT